MSFLEIPARRREKLLGNLVGNGDRRQGDARGRIGEEVHQFLAFLRIGPGHEDYTCSPEVAGIRRLFSQGRMAPKLVTAFLFPTVWQIAENHHPFVLHLEMNVGIIFGPILALGSS